MWESFKIWRCNRQIREFMAFSNDYEDAKARTEAALEAWGNPFKNGKKGEPYEFYLKAPLCAYGFTGLKELGLTYSKPTRSSICKIEGIPQAAGEFAIVMCYQPDGFCGRDFPVSKKILKLIINPDPRELWNDIPSDPTIEYSRPDQESAILECDDATMFAASLRGRSHAHKGLPRDDAFGLACVEGWHILAVADGAGSAPFSRAGAEIACEAAIRTCKTRLHEANALAGILADYLPGQEEGDWQPRTRTLAYQVVAQAAFEAHKAIRQEAAEKNRDIKVYATTLLLTLSKKMPDGFIILSFQVGDGAMALFSEKGPLLLAKPDEGEFSGQTKFLTMADIFDSHDLMRRLRVSYVSSLTAILMMTDGVSDPRFGTQDGLEDSALWDGLYRELQPLLQAEDPEKSLLEWLNFWEKGHHDDRTLGILVPKV